jgi:hypothetical protein
VTILSWATPVALHAALASGSDPFVLEWDDAVGCADANAVVARVRQVVGDELARGELRRPVVARGRVRAIPRGMELVLVVDDPTTGGLERRIEAPDCVGIVEAAAVVLATSAIPEPVPEPAPSCPPASPVPQCPVAPTVTPRASVPPREPPRRRHRAIVGVEAVLGVAMIDAIAPGIAGRVGWSHGAARLDLGVRHVFAQHVAMPTVDVGADVSSTMVELRGCWAPALGRVAVPLCAGVSAGVLQAAGSGDLAPRRVSRKLALAVAPSLGVRVGLTARIALAADAALFVPILRPGFHVDGTGDELFRAPPVGAVFSLGLEVRAP